MEFFQSEKISPTITRIRGISGELMYLVTGTQKALLIDSGIGVGDLAAYVKQLTPLPVELVLTHGHMDHAAGAPLFDKAYLHPADLELADAHNDEGMRREYLAMMTDLKAIPEEAFVRKSSVEYLPLSEGQTFALGGGIAVTLLHLQGHTPGSMCAWFPHERSILFGDACNAFTFLFDASTLPVGEYAQVLRTFREQHRGEYDSAYLSHGSGDIGSDILEGVLAVCEDVLAGKTDAVPFSFMGGSYLIAKAMDPQTMMRVDGGIGNLVYDGNRI